MIISRTPYRVSFFGGGTDYPAWYLEEDGAVLSTTIDKYIYLTCRILPPFFLPVRFRVIWRHVESVATIDDILHPAVRAGLQHFGIGDATGLEIHYQGDLPARSGMGSSSTFAVGMIKCLMALRGQMIGKQDLAMQAIAFEQDVMKTCVGSQDQVAAAYGGLNVIRFHKGGQIHIEPVVLPPARSAQLQTNLVLLHTGIDRSASLVAAQVVEQMTRKNDMLREMRGLVDNALAVLTNGSDLDDFGRLLNETWLMKRTLSPQIANSKIDQIYQIACDHGALGGKLLGAGAGGFMLFYIPAERRQELVDALSYYMFVPFHFENEGSTLIYYDSKDNVSHGDAGH